MAYKDKPFKLHNVISLKITHLKYYGSCIRVTQPSRPLIPPSLKRLVKAVGLRLVKTRYGATYLKMENRVLFRRNLNRKKWTNTALG